MSAGDKWELPGGHQAIEVQGSTRDMLRVCVIPPNWPFPRPPQEVSRALCKRLPMRYYGGKTPEGPEALL